MKYDVKIFEHKPFIKTTKINFDEIKIRHNSSVEIIFHNDDGSMCTKEYGYITMDEINESIQEGKDLILDFCYVNNLLLNDTNIKTLFSSKHTFFDGKTSFSKSTFSEETDFRDVEFNGEVNFSKVNFKGDTNFSGAKFSQKANFSKSRFIEKTEFGKVHFKEESYFSGAIFNRSTYFNGSKFTGKAHFIESQFIGEVYFNTAIFENAVYFQGPSCNSELENSEELFVKDVCFINAIFKEKTIFNGAKFGGEADFNKVKFDESVHFIEATFEKKVNFSESTFGLKADLTNKEADFSRSIFKGNADFREVMFNEKAYFSEAEFKEKAQFNTALIKEQLFFCKNIFSVHIDMKFKICNSLVIEDCIIEKILDLGDVKLNLLCLKNTKNIGQVYLDWEKNNIKKALYNYAEKFKLSKDEVAKQFLLLKQNFNTIGRYTDEDEAYVEYKRCEALSKFNKNESNLFKRIKNIAFFKFKWFVTDYIGLYATDPLRIFKALWLNILCFSIIYFLLGVHIEKLENGILGSGILARFLGMIYFSAITSFTVGYGDISPERFLVTGFASIEAFIGVFLMSYFTVAFARRILR